MPYYSSYTHEWNFFMLGKKKQVSQRSLENLKLGSEARRKDKQRHNFTLLPETVAWLKGTGNASDTIDALVTSARDGGLKSNSTHHWEDDGSCVSNNVYVRIDQLEKENNQLQLDLAKQKEVVASLLDNENNQLQLHLAKQKEVIALLQKAVTPATQGGLYKANAAKSTKEAVEQAIALLSKQ